MLRVSSQQRVGDRPLADELVDAVVLRLPACHVGLGAADRGLGLDHPCLGAGDGGLGDLDGGLGLCAVGLGLLDQGPLLREFGLELGTESSASTWPSVIRSPMSTARLPDVAGDLGVDGGRLERLDLPGLSGDPADVKPARESPW